MFKVAGEKHRDIANEPGGGKYTHTQRRRRKEKNKITTATTKQISLIFPRLFYA